MEASVKAEFSKLFLAYQKLFFDLGKEILLDFQWKSPKSYANAADEATFFVDIGPSFDRLLAMSRIKSRLEMRCFGYLSLASCQDDRTRH